MGDKVKSSITPNGSTAEANNLKPNNLPATTMDIGAVEATNAAAPADTVSMDQADDKIVSNDAATPASGDLISVSFICC